MKLNLYIPIFLIITVIPFLFFKAENTKTDEIKILESDVDFQFSDTLQLYNFRENKWDESIWSLRLIEARYIAQDTVKLRFHAGALGGYDLSIVVVGKEFTSKFISFDCTYGEVLKITDQYLILQGFDIENGGKIKGEIFCEAKSKGLKSREEQVKIEGNFEFELPNLKRLYKSTD